MKPKEIIELAEQEGVSRATVYRARDHLGDQIINTGGRNSPSNKWELSGAAGLGEIGEVKAE